ncbi:MAG: hypothetical protein NC543_06070 [bacterium]|nr:hypothetical protein [bacterium]MCM1374534.1 hypothetical protein [Muribaculum sp.]
MRTFQEIYQESYREIRPDAGLVEELLEDARTERSIWMRQAVTHMVLRPVAVAVLAGLILFGGTSALASNVGFVYTMIENTSPALADLFVPVQESCTRAGICMEVEAIHLEEGDKSAEIYISFRDTQGDRINGPADLYDSYGLDCPGATWAVGGGGYVGYDEESGKAFFRIQLSSDEAYDRNKMTLRVRELLLDIVEEDRDIPLTDIASEMPTKSVWMSGRSVTDWEKYVELVGIDMEEPEGFLELQRSWKEGEIPDDPRPSSEVLDGLPASECATDDFTITGLAYWDNVIRLQICMGELSHADRHVIPCLKLADGSERIYWFSKMWHEEKGSERLMFYEFYLPCTPEELENATLYGNFHRTDNSLEGNWKVIFRMEETE